MVDAPQPKAPLLHGNPDEHRRLIAVRANGCLSQGGGEAMTGPLQLWAVAVADLPAAADNEGSMVHVSDEAGGPVPAYSDGTNWLRVSDGAIVS